MDDAITCANITSGRDQVYFFNITKGSQITKSTSKLNFKICDHVETTVTEIKKEESRLYTVRGQLRWVADKNSVTRDHEITSASQLEEKFVREAIFLDPTGDIIMSLWNKKIY